MNREIKEKILSDTLHFFKDLSLDEVNFLVDSSNIIDYEKGELIKSKDRICTGVVIVLNGVVRSFISSHSGREVTLFRLFKYDVCMLSSACDYKNLQYDINVEAEEDSTVIIIESKLFKRLSDTNRDVQKYMFELVQNRLSDVLSLLEQVIFFSIESRIAGHLLDLYYTRGSDFLDITHEKIANNLGTAREVVSRNLKKLEKEKIVEIGRGYIMILDIDKLKVKAVN